MELSAYKKDQGVIDPVHSSLTGISFNFCPFKHHQSSRWVNHSHHDKITLHDQGPLSSEAQVFMKRSYLVLIDPSTRYPETEVCERITRLSPLPVLRISPALALTSPDEYLGIEALHSLPPDHVKALIILGSAASPVEPLDWQTALIEWLTSPSGPLSRSYPILGICYGHQLLGYLAGGQIDILWEGASMKGIREITLREDTLGLKAHLSYPMIVSHREGLRSAPEDWINLSLHAQILGLNPLQPTRAVEVMKHRDHPWWGFQAHVDATEEFVVQNEIPTSFPSPYAGSYVIHSFLKYIQS